MLGTALAPLTALALALLVPLRLALLGLAPLRWLPAAGAFALRPRPALTLTALTGMNGFGFPVAAFAKGHPRFGEGGGAALLRASALAGAGLVAGRLAGAAGFTVGFTVRHVESLRLMPAQMPRK